MTSHVCGPSPLRVWLPTCCIGVGARNPSVRVLAVRAEDNHCFFSRNRPDFGSRHIDKYASQAEMVDVTMGAAAGAERRGGLRKDLKLQAGMVVCFVNSGSERHRHLTMGPSRGVLNVSADSLGVRANDDDDANNVIQKCASFVDGVLNDSDRGTDDVSDVGHAQS
eukprot:jgi/Undpi1/9945/HiC_scaffold_28.g12399.m1